MDDAAVLDTGQCQVETWSDIKRADARTLLHVGPACRVGPVELGLNADRSRTEGTSQNIAGLQAKWAYALKPGLSAGLLVALTALPGRPHNTSATVVVPVTWQPWEAIRVHLNLGRDMPEGTSSTAHAGIAVEAAATADWSFVGERFRESSADAWRVGARWAISPKLNWDLSRAQGLGGRAPAWWTLGVTWVFAR